jgi:hypothetical protein
MIAIVAVRPNVILGRQYLFSPQIEPSIFIFWENMTYCSKSIPFLLRLNYVLKRCLQKEKIGRAIYYRDNRLSALCANERLVNKSHGRLCIIHQTFGDEPTRKLPSSAAKM